jgi:hypothetical protein
MEVGIFDNDPWWWRLLPRKAAKFVMGDYKTTSRVRPMLEHLKWPTLEERRKRAKVTMLYRIIHQVVAIPVQPYLIPRTPHAHRETASKTGVCTFKNIYIYL